MLLPLTLICKKAKVRRDGTSVIKIQYCYTSDKRTELDTEIPIPPKYWNRKSGKVADNLPSRYGNVETLNNRLQIMFRIAEDIIGFAIKKGVNPLEFVKSTFQPDFDTNKLYQLEAVIVMKQAAIQQEVYYQFDQYKAMKQKRAGESMMAMLRSIRGRLKAFETHTGKLLTFESFEGDFRDEFVEFLTYEYVLPRFTKKPVVGLKTNTIRDTTNHLRFFLNDRMRKKIIPALDLTELKAPAEETDAIYLTWEEISRIYQVDLSAYPHLMDSRNTFVLGCLTGMRFSDYSRINPMDIKGDFLKKKQEKTESWVFIPLRPEAAEILDYFKGTVPKMYNSTFNDHVRQVAQLAGIEEMIRFSYKKGTKTVEVIKPKCEWIGSHTARRSFCTNEFLAGTPVELIMKISGHKSLRDFYRYIRITQEEAGRKMMQIWNSRNQSLQMPPKKAADMVL